MRSRRKAELALVVALLAGCAGPRPAVRGEVIERSVAYVQDEAGLKTARAVPDDVFAPHVFTTGTTTLPYRLRAPEPSLLQTQYPLVLVLHDSAAIGTDNREPLRAYAKSWAVPHLAERYAAWIVVPQAPARTADYATGTDGLLASKPGASLAAILALVDDLVARLPQVDRSRIYVVGFSMGASAAIDVLVERPSFFAGAVAIAGVPPDRTKAASVAHVAQWLVHGTRDDENPFGPDHAWAEALARAGARPVFVRYEGMDHRFPADMLLATDWREWLFRQQRGARAEAP